MTDDTSSSDAVSDVPRRLLAGLAARATGAETPALVDVLRNLVEDVVIPVLGPDLSWSTAVFRTGDDLERRPPAPVDGRRWDAVDDAGDELESVYVTGRVPLRPTLPPDPRAEPVHGLLRRPRTGGPATLAVSVHEWALPAGTSGDGLPQAVVRWLLGSAVDADAETGYIALDVADAFDAASAWELAVQAPPSQRDVAATVWGYGWVTLLSAAHVSGAGGREVFAEVPGAVLQDGPGGRLVVRLGDDPAEVTPHQVGALREALQPVLPVGFGSLAEWRALADDPHVVAPPYVL